ncbi:MAG: S49 family peptidase, partial [Ignavibacteriales bacterium]
SLPLIGISLPDRALNNAERTRIEYTIKKSYDQFIAKVAEGRKLSVEYIDSIAQGRVWIGPDALRNGLVDRIGGLSEAIRIAKEKAGIKGDRDIRFVQYPGMPLFNLNFLQPKLFGLENRENEFLEFMKFRIEHNGEPMPVLPLEDWGMNK